MKSPKKKYQQHKDSAKQRGIDFNLSFAEWWDIWHQSGKWEQRGCRRGQYVMSRIGDTGAYEVNNVFIQTCSGNNSDAHKGRAKPRSGGNSTGPWSDERKKQHSDKLRGRKQPNKPCEYCGINISLTNYDRHSTLCKKKK